jgi:hypothetical protein
MVTHATTETSAPWATLAAVERASGRPSVALRGPARPTATLVLVSEPASMFSTPVLVASGVAYPGVCIHLVGAPCDMYGAAWSEAMVTLCGPVGDAWLWVPCQSAHVSVSVASGVVNAYCLPNLCCNMWAAPTCRDCTAPSYAVSVGLPQHEHCFRFLCRRLYRGQPCKRHTVRGRPALHHR